MKNKYSKIIVIKVTSLLLISSFLALSLIPAINVSANTIPEISTEEFCLELADMLETAEEIPQKPETEYLDISEEYSDKDFSTMRLIVFSERKINTLNAVDVISGYRNMWILQFESIEDTISAYEYYLKLNCISAVEPDEEVALLEDETSSEDGEESDFLSWGTEFCCFDKVLDEINEDKLPEIYVAVVDSGILMSHPFLADRVEDSSFGVASAEWGSPSKTVDDNGHGTHVAGIIADSTPKNVIIKPYKVLDERGTGTSLKTAAGIFRAVDDGADVINLSLGSKHENTIIENAVNYADGKGAIVVCAAGNKANDKPHYPAAYQSTVSVSAVDSEGSLAYFSSYGETVDIAAPGCKINSTFLDNEFREFNGTSMAAPFVSAAFAIAKSLHPKATNAQLKALMFSNAQLPDIDNATLYFGYGFLDVTAVIRNVPDNVEQYTFAESPSFSVKEGMYKDSLEFTMSASTGDSIYYTLDGTSPSEESILYDGNPIKISSSTVVKAIAVSEHKKNSKSVQRKYCIVKPVPESEIRINDDGTITDCTTRLEEIYIPELVHGITPISIATDAFSKRNDKLQYVKALYLPESVTDIQSYAFCENDVIQMIYANGVRNIGNYAFSECDYLELMNFNNLITVGNYSFNHIGKIHKGLFQQSVTSPETHFPELIFAGKGAFYNSAIKYFEAPKLKNIGEQCFSLSDVADICCPELEELPYDAFTSCTNLQECELKSVKTIKENAFTYCNDLISVSFPSCTFVDSCAFYECKVLMNLDFPVLKRMPADFADWCINIRTMEFPSLEEVYYVTGGGNNINPVVQRFIAPKLNKVYKNFFSSDYLKYLSVPGLKEITLDSFGWSGSYEYLDISGCTDISSDTAFDHVPNIDMIIATSLVNADSLPKSFSMLTSSSLQSINCEIDSAIFYGIPGSYAEKYAGENGYTFMPIPYIRQNDIPNTVRSSGSICIVPLGFNLSYQWYASADGNTDAGIILNAETENVIDVANTIQAPYYYCVVTCEENGVKYTSTTKAIKNSGFKSADYSVLDELLKTVPENLSCYTDDSVGALNDVFEKIDRNLDASSQKTVEGYIQAVSSAISNLTLKKHNVSFFVDSNPILSYELEYGKEITDTPSNPEKSGYTFSKWTPDIPPAMPNNPLIFTAEYEPITYYASFTVDGEEIEKVPFTVESEIIPAPAVPEKEGYIGKWSNYIIAASDITVNAVYEKEKQPKLKPSISLRNYSAVRRVDYRTTITFTAISDDLPENAKIVWYKDRYKVGEGEKYTVKDAREAFNIQAKIVYGNDKILNSTETELVKVKTSFFSRLIAFFRMLFGKLPTIEQ